MKGSKTGGRKAGTPNRKTNDVIELINNKYPNFNPILSLIEISQDQNIDLNIRTSCLKEIASYMFPKRKAIEIDANVNQEVVSNNEISPSLKLKIDEILKKDK